MFDIFLPQEENEFYLEPQKPYLIVFVTKNLNRNRLQDVER